MKAADARYRLSRLEHVIRPKSQPWAGSKPVDPDVVEVFEIAMTLLEQVETNETALKAAVLRPPGGV